MNENETKVETKSVAEASTVPSNDERIAKHLRSVVESQEKSKARHDKRVVSYLSRIAQLRSTGGGFTRVGELEIREGTRCDACGRPHLRNAIVIRSAAGTELTVSRKCADLLTQTI